MVIKITFAVMFTVRAIVLRGNINEDIRLHSRF